MVILTYVITLIISYFSLLLYTKIAKKTKIVALGNNKNLHFGEIPRGAGLVFGTVYLSLITFAYFQKNISFEVFLLILTGSFVCIILGFLDDVKDLKILSKLIVQFLIISIILHLVFDSIVFSEYLITNYFIMFSLAFISLWMLNAYNFLDGSDGHLVSVTLMQCLLMGITMYVNSQLELLWPIFFLFSVLLVFLKLNWPPASVFMGDSGSLFIGINMIIFVLISLKNSLLEPLIVFIILSYFLIDTLGTLILRVFIKKSWKHRHRSHPYQNFSRKFSHQKTLLMVIGFHLFWLLPIIILTINYPTYEILLCLASLLPSFIFLIKYGPLFSAD